MSINKSPGPGTAFWDGEMVLQNCDNVQVIFKKNTHSNEHLKGTKVGKALLTNYRLVFNCTGRNDMMRELSMPFKQIKDFEIKQPVFGANHLYGKLVAEPNGGWEGSVIFEMSFKNGGAIQVGQKLVELATKPLQPMYVASTIHFSQQPPQQHPYNNAYNNHQPPPPPPQYAAAGQYGGPPPPPAYQMPQPEQYGGQQPPSYAGGHQQQAPPSAPSAPGSQLPPGYDPYQQPPAYNNNNNPN